LIFSLGVFRGIFFALTTPGGNKQKLLSAAGMLSSVVEVFEFAPRGAAVQGQFRWGIRV